MGPSKFQFWPFSQALKVTGGPGPLWLRTQHNRPVACTYTLGKCESSIAACP